MDVYIIYIYNSPLTFVRRMRMREGNGCDRTVGMGVMEPRSVWGEI